MKNLVSSFEQLLPHWFEKTQMQWVQWFYALWQILRCNPLTLLVLSVLPFYLGQMYKKKKVVVLDASKGYDMSVDEMREYVVDHPLRNLEVVDRIHYWYTVKHLGYYYITHQNTLAELAKCAQLIDDDIGNIIFVERLLTITDSLSVGKRLSQTEAYERILAKQGYHCSKGTNYVVPTWFDYVDLSSKFWVVLCTIPILLQAKSYNRFSNLLSLVIILLDLCRGWLYKLYDDLFDSFAKFVKLHIFKKRSNLYNFCSIFSTRWRYCDTVKNHAYVAKPGEKMRIRCYSKLESLADIEIVGWEMHNSEANDQHIYMEIVKDRAHCNPMEYDEVYAVVKLRRPIYVSDHNLRSNFMNAHTADEGNRNDLILDFKPKKAIKEKPF